MANLRFSTATSVGWPLTTASFRKPGTFPSPSMSASSSWLYSVPTWMSFSRADFCAALFQTAPERTAQSAARFQAQKELREVLDIIHSHQIELGAIFRDQILPELRQYDIFLLTDYRDFAPVNNPLPKPSLTTIYARCSPLPSFRMGNRLLFSKTATCTLSSNLPGAKPWG